MSSRSSRALENLIQSNYHSTYPGPDLPPLWQVIYQEAMRGHHLLFRKADAERYESEMKTVEFWHDEESSEDLELTVLRVVGCPDLQAMVKVIDSLNESRRRNLYFMYRRVLLIWSQYVKTHLN